MVIVILFAGDNVFQKLRKVGVLFLYWGISSFIKQTSLKQPISWCSPEGGTFLMLST